MNRTEQLLREAKDRRNAYIERRRALATTDELAAHDARQRAKDVTAVTTARAQQMGLMSR